MDTFANCVLGFEDWLEGMCRWRDVEGSCWNMRFFGGKNFFIDGLGVVGFLLFGLASEGVLRMIGVALIETCNFCG